MSRAFVKELDGDAVTDDAPELPISPHPNHVTPAGLAALRQELDDLTDKRRENLAVDDGIATKLKIAAIERRQRYLVRRIDSAIEHDPSTADNDRVEFGATVVVEDENSEPRTFTIVGEDEADPANHLISWTSPLARNLMNKVCGDDVRWVRPRGDAVLYVVSISYGGTSIA